MFVSKNIVSHNDSSLEHQIVSLEHQILSNVLVLIVLL